MKNINGLRSKGIRGEESAALGGTLFPAPGMVTDLAAIGWPQGWALSV